MTGSVISFTFLIHSLHILHLELIETYFFRADPLGRKRSMILVNIPIVFGWLLLYNGDAIWKVFTGCAFLGLAIGLYKMNFDIF